MQDDAVLGVGEAAFSAELARVNLLRMRGDFDAARNACFSILKKLPGSITAHTLMGDIYADQDDLASALEWVDLALELDPGSASLQVKKQNLMHRIQDREAAETVQQLGIPTAKPQVKMFIWATIVFVAAIGVVGFLAGKTLINQRPPATYQNPIQVNLASPPVEGDLPQNSSEPKPSVVTATPATVAADDEVLAKLRAETKDRDRWIAAAVADRHALLTAATKDGDDFAQVAKDLAAAAGAVLPDYVAITVRVVQNGAVVASAGWPAAVPPVQPPADAENKATDQHAEGHNPDAAPEPAPDSAR